MEETKARLLFAIKFNDAIGVEKILQEGVDLNQPVNVVGQTPLILAVMKGSLPIVELLLSAGADPNLQDNGGTTALMLIWDRDLEITRALIEAGADRHIANLAGETALDVARRKQQTATMALLGHRRKVLVTGR